MRGSDERNDPLGKPGAFRLFSAVRGSDERNDPLGKPGAFRLFRDIFRGVFLPYRDPETLNLFLKEIDIFSYDNSERLGDAFEYLLSVLGTQDDARDAALLGRAVNKAEPLNAARTATRDPALLATAVSKAEQPARRLTHNLIHRPGTQGGVG